MAVQTLLQRSRTDGLRGSNVYEVNPWLWQFGLGKPSLGGLTIKETSERKDAVFYGPCTFREQVYGLSDLA